MAPIKIPVDPVATCAPYSTMFSRRQLNALVAIHERNYARSFETITSLRSEVGNHPHLRYLAALIHAAKRDRAQQRRKFKREQRAAREWWLHGGQSETYLKNHGRFGGDHLWFTNAIARRTGMCARDEEVWDLDEEEVDSVSTVTWVKIPKKCKFCGLRSCHEFEFGCAAEHTYMESKMTSPKVVKVRDPVLVLRIRSLIAALVDKRIKKERVFSWIKPVEKQVPVDAQEPIFEAQHQMLEPDEHGEGSVSTVKTSNVVITEQHSSDQTNEVPTPSQMRIVSGDVINTFPTLCSRPYVMVVKPWSTTDVVDTALWSCNLPRDFLTSAKDSPNVAPFKVHRYFRGDIMVRVQLNANKFMSGQLQISWFYQSVLDRKTSLRENCFSGSQTLHTLLNAGTSNEAVLMIPYRYYKPILEIAKREDKEESLQMGTLTVRVLNQLASTSAASNTCYFTVFVSLVDCQFTGTIAAGINHQMDPATGLMAAAMFTKFSDLNRDNPTTSANPTYFAPQVAQSWSIGTNAREDLYSLRLSSAMVPTSADYAVDEFTVSSIVQRYGLLARGNWKSNAVSGTGLCNFPATPIMRVQDYSGTIIGSETCYMLPPVSVLSSLFQYWRGSLILRMDFVATQMHTGRLLIGYVPGDYQADLAMDSLYSSPYAEFDLKESQMLEFRIPFVSDKKYWPRVTDLDDVRSNLYAPGFVYCFVLNPLVCMDSISNEIQFNVYLAGGSDFELVVPAQSTIGLSFNTKTLAPTTDYFYRKGGYNDGFYVGTYHNLYINNKPYSQNQLFAINRWGVYAGHVVEYNYPPSKAPNYKRGDGSFAYYCKCSSPIRVRSSPDGQERVDVQYFFPWMDGTAMYMLPFKSDSLAVNFIKLMLTYEGDYDKIFTGDKPEKRPDHYFFVYPNDDADPYYDAANLFKFEIKQVTLVSRAIVKTADHQTGGDNRFVLSQPMLDPAGLVPSTSHGGNHFGENFNDLKDYCRRYQPYGYVNFSSLEIRAFKPGDVMFTFPVLPQGLDLNIDTVTNTPEFINKCRDGTIPILLSAYRYYKGSVRFRLILPEFAGSFFVQHKPTIPLESEIIQSRAGHRVDSSDAMLNHGYAFAVQTQRVNNILSFEIPFYLQYDSMLLQRNTLKSGKVKLQDYHTALSLGEVRVGLLQSGAPRKDTQKQFAFQIAYSLGDDAQPSVFQGFPPMLFLQDIAAGNSKVTSHMEEAEHQMFKGLKKICKSGPAVKEIVEDLKELNLTETKDLADRTLVNVGETIHMANEALQNATEFCSTGIESFHIFMDNLRHNGAPTFLVAAFGQIAQVINNPKPSVMAIAIGAFLINLGFITVQSLTTFTDLLTSFFGRLQPKQLNGEVASATHQTINKEDGVAIASMLFAGISTALNTKQQASSKFSKGIANDVLDGVTSGCKDGSYFFRFLSNIIGVIMKIFEYLKRKLFPQTYDLENVVDCEDIIKRWVAEAVVLTDVELEPMYDIVPALAERVEACYVVGSLIMARLTVASKSVNIIAIKDLHNKVCTLRIMLADKGSCSAFRREPFILYMLGKPGCGKSQMAYKTIVKLLRDVDIPFDTSPIYTHPAGAKYWENVKQEPAMLIDDAFILRSGETCDLEIATMMSLKSTALFTPPIAECDRKKKRYAPELVWVHTNTAFPELNNMQCSEAIYRRRDMLWETRMKDGILEKDIHAHYTNMQLNRCEHLEFRCHLDPRNKEAANLWGEWMPFDLFYQNVVRSFKVFRERMIETHASRVTALNAALMEMTAYPDLVRMPLIDVLQLYSKKSIFPDTSLYVDKTNHLIEGATHQDAGYLQQVVNALNSPKLLPYEKKFLELLFDENFIEVYINFVSIQCTAELIKDMHLRSTSARVRESGLAENLSILDRSDLCLECLRNIAKIVAPELTLVYNNSTLRRIYEAVLKDIHAATEENKIEVVVETKVIENSKIAKNPEPLNPDVIIEEKKILQEFEAALLAHATASQTQVVESMRYKPEQVAAFHKDTHTVCDAHIEQLYTHLEVEKMEAGRKLLLGEKYQSLSKDMRLKMYRLALETYGCPHFWTYCRSWTSKLSTCCMVENDLPHFCKSTLLSGCDKACAAFGDVPLCGEWTDCKHCIRSFPKLLKVYRMLFINNNPGTVIARAEAQPYEVPPVIYECKYKEKILSAWRIIKGVVYELRKFLSKMLDKVFGALRSFWDFMKRHKGKIFSFLGLCSILAGAFIIRKKCLDPDPPAMIPGAIVSAVTTVDSKVAEAIATGTTKASCIGQKIKNYFVSPQRDDVMLDALAVKQVDDTLVGKIDVPVKTAEHEIIASGDPKAHAAAARVAFKAKTLVNAAAINPTASHQMNHEDVVARRIADNTLHLVAMNVDEKNNPIESTFSSSRALAIGDRYVLTVRHSFESWQHRGLKSVRCFVKDRMVDILLRDIKVTPLADSSLCVARMPANFPQFKKIIQFFASELDHMYRCPSDGIIISCGNYITLVDCKISIRSSTIAIDGLPGADRVEIAGLYQYETQSPGLCGSLLVGDGLNSPIIGMHIAGSSKVNVGYAEPLYRESFAELFESRVTDVVEPVFFPVETAKIDLQTTIFPVGSVGKQMAHHSPTETTIHESYIHGYVRPKTAPAPLSEKDPRLPPGNSPLVKGCEKHGLLTQNFDPEVLERTKERLRTHLFAKCKPLRNVAPLKLNDQQAVCGDPQLVYCDPLRWNSSEGYPYFKFRPKNTTNKKWLFKLKETGNGISLEGYNDMLGEILTFKRNARADGIQQPTIFVDCLKDARIQLSKCSMPGKTRIFSMSPVDYTIEFRRYFYDFIASFQSKRMTNFNAIGINVFSEEWNLLALSLLRHRNICTGDYSNFGPGLNLEVARICLEIILDWYDHFDDCQSDEDRRTRACLVSELIGSLHLCHDLVYRVVAGIPSGSPITVVLNSLVNIFYLFAAWDMLADNWPIELRAFSNFENNVVLYTYGDDFIFSVSDLYRDLYNSKIISELFVKFWIKLTDAFKGDDVTPYSTLTKSTFLKGAFVQFDGRYWYGLDKDQIYDMVNFVNSKFNKVELTKVNADMSLIHAHGHGKKFFDKVKSKIIKAFGDKDVAFQGRTFHEITVLKTSDVADPAINAVLKKLLPIF